MLKGLILLSRDYLDLIYGPDERAAIAQRVELVGPAMDADEVVNDPTILRDVDVIFSGWGAPPISPVLLENAPRLRAIFYAGGSIRFLVNDTFWARGLRITSSYAMNGLAVADYAVGAILFGLKHGFTYALGARQNGSHLEERSAPGVYGSTLGIISMGAAGRALRERVRGFDLNIIAHDPFLSDADAAALEIKMVGLDELFQQSDVVSLHTPELPETLGLIQGSHFSQMKKGSLFINTARGAIVDEPAMIRVLQTRPDITAILDVTEPEPPMPGSPLYSMPNVVLTPHIAGAMGRECRRMGRCMIEEFDRWQRGDAMLWEITQEKLVHMA
jgi:phosphoglycerate dehydrogenase-like enzyme